MPTRPINNSAYRCIQSGLGSSVEWSITHRGCMISQGSISPHKLPGVAGSLLGNQGFREDMAEYHSLTASGQCHSSELHKPERGHSVESPVPTSNNNLNLVCRAKHYSPSRASSRPSELSGRPRVQNSEGSLRLEAEAICVPSNSGSDGPLEVDLFASRLISQLPRFYS